MTKLEQLIKLNQWLLDDMPQYQAQAKEFLPTEEAHWRLFRSLINVREPGPASDEFIKLQNAFLQKEIADKGITDVSDLTPVRNEMYLWQGDITTLIVDAIVNAANMQNPLNLEHLIRKTSNTFSHSPDSVFE